ncbi:MAG: Leucine-responsive regulatory protein [Alphaproteobacteria bacterium MarineAlpha5_Bin4]|nr:MAG: Leucine-responsive regulatory protein [Alphaproteobacteria bacterium MarineAlpha5_Bin4]|tara:strand:- start:2001 stop:2462 length:462 start_codon:yes stop_codon:yes gene_type:complete
MDDIDKKILKELQKNSSLPLSELSKRVGISSTPCWNRIKKMEELKIILSKSIILDNKKINLPITVFLSISIQNHSHEWLKNFQKIIQKYDEIIEVHRLTGSNSDYQLTILSSSIEEYDKFQQKIINEIECTNMSSHISLQTIKKNNFYSLDYI